MNIVLFGASGFVGRSLVPFLIKNNHSVTLVNRNEYIVPLAKSILVDSLFDIHLYRDALISSDVVIYLSGLAHISNKQSYQSLSLYLASNYYPLALVAQLCASSGVKRFIYFSSSKVLGEFTKPGSCFCNSSPPNPSNAYSYSKHLSEKFLFRLSSLYSTDFVVLRPPLIYGGDPKGNIKSLIKLLRLSIPLPILSLQYNKRSMISLDNLNRFVSAILEFSRPINRSLLISDGNEFSTVEFVNYVAYAYGVRPFLFHFPPFMLSLFFRLFNSNYFHTLICSFQVDISETCDLLNFEP